MRGKKENALSGYVYGSGDGGHFTVWIRFLLLLIVPQRRLIAKRYPEEAGGRPGNRRSGGEIHSGEPGHF